MKWCLREFKLLELPAMETWFQKMAAKGWLIQRIHGGNFFGFEKMEPSELVFSVGVIGNMSVLSAENCEESLSYREYCEQAGWTFACSNRVIQIFYAQKADGLLPIETDEQLKFEAVWKQIRKAVIGQSLLGVLWLFLAFRFLDAESLLRSSVLFSSMLLISCSLIFLLDSIRILCWYWKGKWALKTGHGIRYCGWKKHAIYGTLWLGIEFLIIILCLGYMFTGSLRNGIYRLIYFVLYLLFLLLLQWLIRKRGFSKLGYSVLVTGGAIALVIVMMVVWDTLTLSGISNKSGIEIRDESWLLTLEDFEVPEGPVGDAILEQDSSIFGSRQEYHVWQEKTYSLDYKYYETEAEWLMERLKGELLTPYKSQYDEIHREFILKPQETYEDVKISCMYDRYTDEEGRVLEEHFWSYILETSGRLLQLNFSGSYELTEEELLYRAAERISVKEKGMGI